MMTELSLSVIRHFPVRKSREQKEQFRTWLSSRLEELGWSVAVEEEKSLVASHNVVAGDPENAELILTAHYDTPAVLPIPNLITPCNPLAFLAYQILLTVVIMAIAVVAEVAVIALGASLLVAMLTLYAVLGFLLWWMLAGKANRNNVNDNTSGVMTLLEVAQALTPQQRERVALVFFDNEEKGLLGSAAFYKRHKTQVKDTLLINFDCVSDGDDLLLFPSKAVKGEQQTLARLECAFAGSGEKRVSVRAKGFAVYPSDQKHFPRSVGAAAFHRIPVIGFYLGRIHTGRDTVLDRENIELLRAGVLRLLD